jgi:hypothetical protein
MKDLLAGLAIIAKYSPDASMCAEHDCIYVAPDIEEDTLSPEDRETLEAISGWHWSEDANSWGYFT